MKSLSISPDQIPDIIRHHEQYGARPAQVEIATRKRLLKRSRATGAANPFGCERVKLAKLSVFFNTDYQTAVNRQRARENKPADFTAEPNWFSHETRSIVLHKGEARSPYIFLRVIKELAPPRYFVNGVEVEKSGLVEFLPKSDLQDDPCDKQGLNSPVCVRCLKLESILSITIDNVHYAVVPTLRLKPLTKTTKRAKLRV